MALANTGAVAEIWTQSTIVPSPTFPQKLPYAIARIADTINQILIIIRPAISGRNGQRLNKRRLKEVAE